MAMFLMADTAGADSFGEGENQFILDFAPISSATNPTSGSGIVNHYYRMGVYEVANAQWNKFTTSPGVTVTGSPSTAYDSNSSYTGANVPTDNVSWYEAAQFVNWLNTSTDHHAAYKFTGTQGTSDYTFAVWSAAEAAEGTNLYRHKDAFYYLPTDDEWVKAAYWNSTELQTYATKAGENVTQGNGTSGTGWNYYDNGWATDPYGPWNVGSGSEELNGTYDMMGNVYEWTENTWASEDYGVASERFLRGGSYSNGLTDLEALTRGIANPANEASYIGFRVASVPEPGSLAIFLAGAMGLLGYAWRRRKRMT